MPAHWYKHTPKWFFPALVGAIFVINALIPKQVWDSLFSVVSAQTVLAGLIVLTIILVLIAAKKKGWREEVSSERPR